MKSFQQEANAPAFAFFTFEFGNFQCIKHFEKVEKCAIICILIGKILKTEIPK